MFIQYLYLAILASFAIVQVEGLKIFLLGGAVPDNATDVYNAMVKATGKAPRPNDCDQDWSKTTCPKVAVITSAAQTEE